jgi:hypothetical protein
MLFRCHCHKCRLPSIQFAPHYTTAVQPAILGNTYVNADYCT